MFSLLIFSYRNTPESSEELKKAVGTLAFPQHFSFSQTFTGVSIITKTHSITITGIFGFWSGVAGRSKGATSEYPSTPFTCVGVLWRTRNITIVSILIQWDANKWTDILEFSRSKGRGGPLGDWVYSECWIWVYMIVVDTIGSRLTFYHSCPSSIVCHQKLSCDLTKLEATWLFLRVVNRAYFVFTRKKSLIIQALIVEIDEKQMK